jgi:glutamine amidotransferase
MSDTPARVAVIDYEMSNLFSVQHACRFVGLDPVVTSDRDLLLSADAAILPGVGAFGDAMKSLERLGLSGAVRDFIASGRPFMGICLGLQLLFTRSEEFGDHKGLDVVAGRVVKFPPVSAGGRPVKVPYIGWNQVRFAGPPPAGESHPMRGVKDGEHMYFVHSYYVVPDDESCVLTRTDYDGIGYCSSVLSGNLFACQFHPEKSAAEGLRIYRNWARSIGMAREAS